MTSTLPQASYFRHKFTLPGTQWTLSGHSRALERTGFILTGGGARIMLDAGVDVPDMAPLDMIAITHTHIDHCNAMPMLARYSRYVFNREKSLTHIFCPRPVLHRLREFVQMSFAIKVDECNEVPDHYSSPPRHTYASSTRTMEGGGSGAADECKAVYADWEETRRRWYPVEAGQCIPVALGKGSKRLFNIHPVEVDHTVSTVGYVISDKRMKLRRDLEGMDKKTTAERVRAAKEKGEEITVEQEFPICAYVLDTTTSALTTCAQAEIILSCPVVIIECTYLHGDMDGEATRRGHVVWTALRDIVRDTLLSDRACRTFVLTHFSLRYTDEEIENFFRTQAGLGSARVLEEGSEEVPHVVLMLDSGIKKFIFSCCDVP